MMTYIDRAVQVGKVYFGLESEGKTIMAGKM